MIGISKLYCGSVQASDPLRYARDSRKLPPHMLQFSADRKPVVVWNCTRRCNLRCAHCYSASDATYAKDEMSTTEGEALIDDLSDFGVPVLLFSGGEPLLREDLPHLLQHASSKNLRAVISTNGTQIDLDTAKTLRDANTRYVGVSLDGIGDTNDNFRGVAGAFDAALTGIRNCLQTGVKVGLRMTLHRGNIHQIDEVFELIRREGIPRVCFYHLVATGRGGELSDVALAHHETRSAILRIMDRAAEAKKRKQQLEVLTVDNHADGPLIVLRLQREDPARAAEAVRLLEMNGGNGSGVRIGCVAWDGTVHPDQFWRTQKLGNLRNRRFSEIWSAPDQPLLARLRDRHAYLKGRCARCRWLTVCNGNLRARAEAAGDVWGDDPACYLTDDEIAVNPGETT